MPHSYFAKKEDLTAHQLAILKNAREQAVRGELHNDTLYNIVMKYGGYSKFTHVTGADIGGAIMIERHSLRTESSIAEINLCHIREEVVYI